MAKKIEQWIARYRCMDWAVLYMRLFAGALMLFHNIGKMQDYSDVIGSYPSFLFFSPTTVFVAVAVTEALLGVLIIMGLWVRISALILSLGMLLSIVWNGFGTADQAFVWLGIYVFLIISGGGIYGFDAVFFASGRKK